MKKIILIFSLVAFYTHGAFCEDFLQNSIIPLQNEQTYSEDSNLFTDITFTGDINTQCATAVFRNALYEHADEVSETDMEYVVQGWIYSTFQDKNVIQKVLNCPEFLNAKDTDLIKLLPIEYNFPGGRQIIVNYETQPKILKQRLSLSKKRTVSDLNPSPQIGAAGDDSVWTNTEPAWYAIMVVEAGSLDEFVGPDKNNTISMQWINDNIDRIYPKGYMCTSKSAVAKNTDLINIAARETVNMEDDPNQYYVAGDVNLQWISYLEIGLDVALTVATFGTGAAIRGSAKLARATKTLNNLKTTLSTLSKTDSVRNYIRVSQQLARASEELKNIDRATDAVRYASKSDEIADLTKTLRNIEKTDDNVRKFKEANNTFSAINQYRKGLRLLRPAQRGNVVAKLWRGLKGANTGGRLLNRGARIARSSMKSGRIRDWLFQSTLKSISALGLVREGTGLIYGIINFVGGMYDWTETSTGEFTNNIEFKPLTLLSADDLEGQENVVNHGMWLMWLGDSISPEDDDAAYLQAMDFANKLHFSLENFQEEKNVNVCNVDIYVVRPVIRNPGDENAELYYLIMNEEPWTTK